VANSFKSITPEQADLIRGAKIFFIASAAKDWSVGPDGQGPVNLSPKGATPLHIVDEHRVAYLDYDGSGNETGRHAGLGGPVTVMVMSMDAEDAAIVRLYGTAKAVPVDESELKDVLLASDSATIELPRRQIIDIAIDSTQTSCGYGVPVFEFAGQRVRKQRGRRYKAR
jgi:hypothetical protein